MYGKLFWAHARAQVEVVGAGKVKASGSLIFFVLSAGAAAPRARALFCL